MAYKAYIKYYLRQAKKVPSQLFLPRTKQKKIIWIAGVQRSGTNMMMTAFDNHKLTHVFHESDPRAYVNYSLKSNDFLQTLFQKKIAPYIVAKSLLDADRLLELLEVFPESKAVWPVRNYNDVVKSHKVLWPDYREEIDEIAQGKTVNSWRGRNIAKETRKKIQDLYHPNISVIDCKALLWLMRNDYVFQNQLDKNNRVLLLNYEDIAQNPVSGCKLLAKFADLPYYDQMASGIHSRSIQKKQTPDMDPAIKEACEDMQKRLHAVCTPLIT